MLKLLKAGSIDPQKLLEKALSTLRSGTWKNADHYLRSELHFQYFRIEAHLQIYENNLNILHILSPVVRDNTWSATTEIWWNHFWSFTLYQISLWMLTESLQSISKCRENIHTCSTKTVWKAKHPFPIFYFQSHIWNMNKIQWFTNSRVKKQLFSTLLKRKYAASHW